MAVTNYTGLQINNPQVGIQITKVTDSSSDWSSIANSTYFYDKATSIVYFKDSNGIVLSLFSSNGTVTSVGLSTGTTGTDVNVSGSPITGSGSMTLNIPIASASNTGKLSSTDWTTFNNKGNGTVTSVSALTIGTIGTDVTSTVATGTSTPVITLNVPTASATNRGALSSTDWSTFNNKQNAITLTTTGTTGVATLVGSTLNIPNYSTVTPTYEYGTTVAMSTFNYLT